MNKIALSFPGPSGTIITNPVQASGFNNLGNLISGLANIAFYIAGFLLLSWFAWGVFQYIFAGGDKEKLSKARSRITWAIVGFFITALAFAIAQFTEQIFPQINPPVTNITAPP